MGVSARPAYTPGRNAPTHSTEQPTKPGTPCVHCGKPIGKAMCRAYPYTDVCGKHCFIADSLKLLV